LTAEAVDGAPGRTGPGPTTIALALLIPTAGVLPVFLLGGLAVQMQADLGFGASGLGAGVGAYFLASALGSAAAGRLVHRIGAVPAMRLGVLVAIGSLLGIAGLARSTGVLMALLVVGGLANSVCQPGINDLLAREVPVDRQGIAFAIKQSAIPFGTLLGGLAVPLVALTVGWRWAYVAGAGLALVALALTWRGRGGGPASGRRQPDRSAVVSLPVRALAVLACAAGLAAAGGNSIGSFLVASSVHVGLSEPAAGFLLAGVSVVMLVVRIGMGLLADRRGRGYFEMVAVMMAVGTVGYLLLATGGMAVLALGAAVAAGGGWGWPGLFNLAVVDLDRRAAAVATGITQTGVYLGAVGGPLLFGAIAERVSFGAAWVSSGVLGLLGSVTVLLGRRALGGRERAPSGV
jgi:MFS family permease